MRNRTIQTPWPRALTKREGEPRRPSWRRNEAVTAAGDSPRYIGQSMARVLVVDDDRDINLALQSALKVGGYEADGVETGAAALDVCARACPDLVLLDLMLPDLDGLEVCRRLRASPATARVPIVFLTARTDEATRVRGLALGADDYVVKPFSIQELLLRIRAVLRRATPVEMRLPPLWVRMRDQYRVLNGYAEIHS